MITWKWFRCGVRDFGGNTVIEKFYIGLSRGLLKLNYLAQDNGEDKNKLTIETIFDIYDNVFKRATKEKPLSKVFGNYSLDKLSIMDIYNKEQVSYKYAQQLETLKSSNENLNSNKQNQQA